MRYKGFIILKTPVYVVRDSGKRAAYIDYEQNIKIEQEKQPHCF